MLGCLAHSVVCFRQGQLDQCDAALAQAAAAAARVDEPARTELLAIVTLVQGQRAQASPGQASDAVRPHAASMARMEAEEPAQALPLFEASLALSREEQNPQNVAMNLLAIGQTLLLLGRTANAVDRLREGLDLAGELGEEELVKAFRTILTIARQSPEEDPVAE